MCLGLVLGGSAAKIGLSFVQYHFAGLGLSPGQSLPLLPSTGSDGPCLPPPTSSLTLFLLRPLTPGRKSIFLGSCFWTRLLQAEITVWSAWRMLQEAVEAVRGLFLTLAAFQDAFRVLFPPHSGNIELPQGQGLPHLSQ